MIGMWIVTNVEIGNWKWLRFHKTNQTTSLPLRDGPGFVEKVASKQTNTRNVNEQRKHKKK